MGKRHLIAVQPDGSVQYVHTDAVGLKGVGTKTVRRLSNVEFEDGEWVARDAVTGEEIARDEIRGECIKDEVRHYTALLRRGAVLAGCS